MDTFAFIIHPIEPKRDVARKFPLAARLFNERQIDFLSTFFPPVYISEIEGITSKKTGKQIKGWFIACPLTPARMLELPESTVYRKIIQTGRLAEKLDAQILGLGAFTSVVGDGGITVARELSIPVTTGDSYTVAVAMQAVYEAARVMDIELSGASAAVLGATGAIGQVCSEILAGRVAELYLVGRQSKVVEHLGARLRAQQPHAQIHTGTDVGVLDRARVILAVSSSVEALIKPEHLQPGSVVCDVARPRDVSARVANMRKDVLVIDGGMVEVPGSVNFNFDFGFPVGKAYACMAETMALALEGRFEDYTLGKTVSRARVDEIERIASEHGFRLGGFRSFERAVTPDQIERVRRLASLPI